MRIPCCYGFTPSLVDQDVGASDVWLALPCSYGFLFDTIPQIRYDTTNTILVYLSIIELQNCLLELGYYKSKIGSKTLLHTRDFTEKKLLLPGSIAAKVFHEVLLDTCSDLTSHCWPQDSRKKRKKDGPKSSQADGKRSRPQWKDTPEVKSENLKPLQPARRAEITWLSKY